MSSAYQSLVTKHRELALISSASSTIGWDQETYMPPKAINYRSEQLAFLSGWIHSQTTSSSYHTLLQHAESENHPHATTLANLREWRHQFNLASKLPQELVERDSKTSSLAKAAWAEARSTSSFSIFAPHLASLLEIAKEKADLWGYANEPYDALLGCYERGATTQDVVAIFEKFQPAITRLAKDAVDLSTSTPCLEFQGDFPIESQKILNREVAESIGFDFEAGRIDTTTHPFCTTLGPHDIRLTTRYYEHDFTASLFGIMHEAGHGLYEQGLCSDDFGLPSGSAISLGIHESQSLLWEAHIGRSRAFWNRWLPRAQELFPQLRSWSLDDFLLKINRAQYSFIRVDADEATYDLHILLRFNIERQLLRGEIQVNDIPDAWNQAFESMFGMTPPSDSDGCLQDIHWSMGGLGYFPTYTLGNLNASQLFHTATQDPQIRSAYEKADFSPLLGWMRKHIHQPGSCLLPQDLMKLATGETTNPDYHLAHLRRRFTQQQF